MNTVKYAVPSINCNHCAHTIKSELSEMDGIKSVEADVAKKEVVVQYDSPATPEAIETLLADINYPIKK
jgi:copper chaperone